MRIVCHHILTVICGNTLCQEQAAYCGGGSPTAAHNSWSVGVTNPRGMPAAVGDGLYGSLHFDIQPKGSHQYNKEMQKQFKRHAKTQFVSVGGSCQTSVQQLAIGMSDRLNSELGHK